ncbi:phosphate ABC transporter permease PstA [Staphylococcus simulans]|uniref:Phosphate transport system permease protein PstA n=1 Tax=Staphylococcus simulans TaxID=1286 RepID=A0A6N3AI53_STASI|nr:MULTISPECIES: phosphate ABC transporter permease PstA [Staphylococcus]MBO0386566.1 phosphate ABC transporter permease PstA [Staphylococcus simulans]MBU6943561.1 phosphate ABC transporter permease PstA [Staphylococcus sp. CWZ226]MDN6656062.1 phosphate ABC transporter permease PstA [Staphylococcus simulans]MDQ7115306.1 phosphate ABC transporter permease PstA [Staphylococcus simulans]MDQ7141027.1 phosphate ABC transporter permease PstA [Staphylococcus simulans]
METTTTTNQSGSSRALVNQQQVEKKLSSRLTKNKVLKWVFFACTLIGLIVLAALLIDTLIKGVPYLKPSFFTNFSSSMPSMAGIKGALVGTLWLMITIIPISIILGVGTAIYLEEYAKDNAFTSFVKISISNLAGVPSVVFGLLGLTIFVRGMGIESLSLGKSVIAAALTMSLLILPVIIVSSQEAIRAVPKSVREASYGLGGNKWQTIYKIVLPAALPGILTGFILSLSRALGETAPLILIGIPTILLRLPTGIFDMFQAMPIQIYNWAKMPQEAFQHVASAGIIVLLVLLLAMNGLAIFLRNKFSKKY